MPNKDESDSPTTAAGEGEYFLTPTEKQLAVELEQALDYVNELEYQISQHSDYQKQVKYDTEILRLTLTNLENSLAEKKDTLIDLNWEYECSEAQLNALLITLQGVAERRDNYRQKWEDAISQLRLAQVKKQIVYDTLQSVVFERDILAKKYALAKGKIARREIKINQLSKNLALKEDNNLYLSSVNSYYQNAITEQAEELLQLERIARDYWKSSQAEIKHWQTEAETHLEALGLTEIWNKVKFDRLEKEKADLIKLINQKNDELDELEVEASLTDFHNWRENQKRIEELRVELTHNKQKVKQLEVANQKLTRTKTYSQNRANKLAKENKTLKIKLVCYEDQDKKLHQTIQDLQNQISNHNCSVNCSLPHLPTPHVCPIVQQVSCSHGDYANLQIQLAEKERIIQKQAERIRELENKPPVVETKTIEKEVEKKEDLAKIIEINLNSLEKKLGIELSREAKEELKKVVSYQELSSLRDREIKSYLEKEKVSTATIPPNQTGIIKLNQERVIWISLLVISLLTIGGLLVKLKKPRKEKISNRSSF